MDVIITYSLGTSGSDKFPGSLTEPFKTLSYARDVIRQLKNTSGMIISHSCSHSDSDLNTVYTDGAQGTQPQLHITEQTHTVTITK